MRMENAFSEFIFRFIRRLAVQPFMPYRLLNENFNHASEQKKQELVFNYSSFAKIGNLSIKKGTDALAEVLAANNLSHLPITLMKLDTEGFEINVLTGLHDIFAAQSPVLLFESSELEKTTLLLDFLKAAGYTQFVELQEYLPITPVPITIADRFYPLILASKNTFTFNS